MKHLHCISFTAQQRKLCLNDKTTPVQHLEHVHVASIKWICFPSASSLVRFPQWQFWQLGWQGWLLTRHLQPPDVSPLPFGPQRACLVTQQISVLHIKQQIQSQPSFFWMTMSHRGHFMASPFCSRLSSIFLVCWAARSFSARVRRSSW